MASKMSYHFTRRLSHYDMRHRWPEDMELRLVERVQQKETFLRRVWAALMRGIHGH